MGKRVGYHKRYLMWVYVYFTIFSMSCKNNVCHLYKWMVGGLWIDSGIGGNHWWCSKARVEAQDLWIIIFDNKELRAIRHGTLAPGRRSFTPSKMVKQRQMLATLRSRLVPGIFLIGEKAIKEPLYLLWKVLVFPPFRRILSTVYTRQFLSLLPVAHYQSMIILMLRPR